MANLDTRNKRASALVLDFPWSRVYPNPDGSLANAKDREHVGYSYAGISPGINGLVTRNMRGSAIGIDLNFAHIYPNADGSLGTSNDRKQMAYKSLLASGISASGYSPLLTLLGMG